MGVGTEPIPERVLSHLKTGGREGGRGQFQMQAVVWDQINLGNSKLRGQVPGGRVSIPGDPGRWGPRILAEASTSDQSTGSTGSIERSRPSRIGPSTATAVWRVSLGRRACQPRRNTRSRRSVLQLLVRAASSTVVLQRVARVSSRLPIRALLISGRRGRTAGRLGAHSRRYARGPGHVFSGPRLFGRRRPAGRC